MASFKVNYDFAVPADAVLKQLAAGAVYLAGHNVTGLTAAEAVELLRLAPAGTFTALDAEADTVADYFVRMSGKVATDSQLEVK